MQNLDFGPTHKTGGAKHKINDFCFLKFFILMKFDPSQAQKMIFSQFQLCGISSYPSNTLWTRMFLYAPKKIAPHQKKTDLGNQILGGGYQKKLKKSLRG